jgi:hypothetical protein
MKAIDTSLLDDYSRLEGKFTSKAMELWKNHVDDGISYSNFIKIVTLHYWEDYVVLN